MGDGRDVLGDGFSGAVGVVNPPLGLQQHRLVGTNRQACAQLLLCSRWTEGDGGNGPGPLFLLGPQGLFQCDFVVGIQNELDSGGVYGLTVRTDLDVAVRWTLTGLHGKVGTFGAPYHKHLLILGCKYWRFIEDKIAEEWTVFAELVVQRQVYKKI